jgi:dolichol-phosphate mannosyltransferase
MRAQDVHQHTAGEITAGLVSEPANSAEECDVTIVVPTHREVENLRPLVTRIGGAMSQVGRPYEIIIVDDDSRDGTDESVRELHELGYPVRLITRVGERGLSSAVMRGFSEANGETFICMDADLSHPPEAIPPLLRAVSEPGVDFVVGSRYVSGGSTDEQWGVLRWVNSKLATALARPFTSVKDPMSGFFSISRTVYDKATSLNPVGYKIALELIVKCNCSGIREIPIHFAKRQFGESKLSITERLNYLRHLRRLMEFKCGTFLDSLKRCHWRNNVQRPSRKIRGPTG